MWFYGVLAGTCFIVLFCFFLIVYFVTRSDKRGEKIDNSIKGLTQFVYQSKPDLAGLFKGFDELKGTHMDIFERMGQLKEKIDIVATSQREFEGILRAPTSRGYFGELSLEVILQDQLPPEQFGIRVKLPSGIVPDAHISLANGALCIDSKFPLENFSKLQDDTIDEKTQEELKKAFRRDMRTHLNKVKTDYVCPEKGTADFACVFIPSESIYYYLIKNEFDLLRKYSLQGVQVVSPLTLVQKVELIKAGIRTSRITEEVLSIKKSLSALDGALKSVLASWSTLYNTHLRNLLKKADETDASLTNLKNLFDRIEE